VPTNLLLLVAGALVGLGKLNPVPVILYAVVAFLLTDLAWYEAGRRWGTKILQFFCRSTLNPQTCVDKMVGRFSRHGVKSLLVSKFIFGLDSIASPLSGIAGVNRSRFLLFDGIGASIWVVAYMTVGFVFRDRLDHVAKYSADCGTVVLAVGMGALMVLIIRRLIHWYRFLREFRLAQITPSQLLDKLNLGEPILLLDLQGDLEHDDDLYAIPGATRIDPRKLAFYIKQYRNADLKTNREVVLYSSSSRDSEGARVALALRRLGFEQVRPLAGGLRAWSDLGFPMISDAPTLHTTEHAVFVLREVLQYSGTSIARLLKKSTAEVDLTLERVRARFQRSQIANKPIPSLVATERDGEVEPRVLSNTAHEQAIKPRS
jgi:membrane protein DedA with SNARE-associated domain/rhodanese-related sulfurtransferase